MTHSRRSPQLYCRQSEDAEENEGCKNVDQALPGDAPAAAPMTGAEVDVVVRAVVMAVRMHVSALLPGGATRAPATICSIRRSARSTAPAAGRSP